MRRLLSTVVLIFAWLCANGAIWDAVQVVAWGRMFATYSSYLPVGKALEKTFDGSQPCELCSIAQGGRDGTRQSQPASEPGGGERFVLACETAPPVVITVPSVTWPGLDDCFGATRARAVPVPPPRA